MPKPSWPRVVLASSCAAMAWLVYLGSLHNPFVWDDHRVVLENASIRALGDLRGIALHDVFRPVVNFSYAVDYAVWGLRPLGYHLTSVLLHVVNVLLLFALVRRLILDSRPLPVAVSPAASAMPPAPSARADGEAVHEWHGTAAAFAAAGIFAVHPMLTQAVGWTSGRAEVLATLFFVSSFLAARAWALSGRRRWVGLSVACALLALASKETAIVFPLVLLAYGTLVPAERAPAMRGRLARLWIPLLALSAAGAVVRLFALVAVENASRARFVWSHVLVDLDVLRRYVSMMVLPHGQSIFHTARSVSSALDPLALLDAAWLLALGVLVLKVRRREPVVTFGSAWFLLALLPSALLLVFDIGEPLAEQRVYLAACGFAMAGGAGFRRLREWPVSHWLHTRVVATGVLVAFLVNLALMTVERTRVWSDPVRLWTEAVSLAPDIWVPHRALGDVLRGRGEYGRAADSYLQAVRLRPEQADTYLPLATCLLMAGRMDEADRYFEAAERLAPGSYEASTGRAAVARLTGRRDEARDRLLAVIRAHPDAVATRRLLAQMYEEDYGDRAAALSEWRAIRDLDAGAPGVDDAIRRNERAPAAAQPGG